MIDSKKFFGKMKRLCGKEDAKYYETKEFDMAYKNMEKELKKGEKIRL